MPLLGVVSCIVRCSGSDSGWSSSCYLIPSKTSSDPHVHHGVALMEIKSATSSNFGGGSVPWKHKSPRSFYQTFNGSFHKNSRQYMDDKTLLLDRKKKKRTNPSNSSKVMHKTKPSCNTIDPTNAWTPTSPTNHHS